MLGGGTAGTMVANKMRKKLGDQWQITVVDQSDTHHYQPGYLFLPFGVYDPDEIVQAAAQFLADGVDLVRASSTGSTRTAQHGDAGRRSRARLRLPGHRHRHHAASGPDPGHGRRTVAASVHDFYTLDGAVALRDALRTWSPAGGWSSTSPRCRSSARSRRWSSPSSPTRTSPSTGMRDRVEIVYVTPLRRRVHQADRLGAPRRDARRAQDRGRAGLHGRAHRRRRARRWSPTTSGRSRSTCWSPCR